MSINEFSAQVRAHFPLLHKKIRGKDLIYFDSAATALKPKSVIDRITQFNSFETANVHRGAHYLADMATQDFEASRQAAAKFINASTHEEIVFTKGATDSLNLLANTLQAHVKAHDEILLTRMEHHANIVPWQMLAERVGAKITVVELTPNGELDLQDLKTKLTSKTKIFSFTACSNTLGTINPVRELCVAAQAVGALSVVDAAQLVANHAVDVQQWGADFVVFSMHKLFGPYGMGIMYGKKALLEKMPPYQGGGSMISQVTFAKTTYNDVPFRFEAGTPNIEGVIATKTALDFVKGLDWKQVQQHELTLLQHATEGLQAIPDVIIHGQAANKAPIVSFNIKGAHHSDIGQILDQENIAVRVGHHCTQPLLQSLGVTGTVRASFSIYNTSAEVDLFLAAVKKAKDMLL